MQEIAGKEREIDISILCYVINQTDTVIKDLRETIKLLTDQINLFIVQDYEVFVRAVALTGNRQGI